MFNGLVSSKEPPCQALSHLEGEACVHMCCLSMLAEGDLRPHPAVAFSKPL